MPKSKIGQKKLSGAQRKREACKKKVTGGAANRGMKKGQGALKAGSAFRYSNASSKIGRTAPNGAKNVKGSHYRTESTIKRLNMYKDKPNVKKMREQATKPCRIQPDRRWFGNTRVIAQDKMQAFRETLSKGVEDPYSIVLKSSKLPMSLLRETEDKASRMNLLSISPYTEAFGKKRQQKRPKLGSYDLEGLLKSAEEKADGYEGQKDQRSLVDPSSGLDKPDHGLDGCKHHQEEIFNKGTSKRIWTELYKVVDSSDVLVEVLDARDPMGTRCHIVEHEIRKNRPHKHIVLVLNKVDLVPTWVSRRWLHHLMKDYPTLAFHASISNPFGKNSLLNLLRQFSNLMQDKKHVTVGMIGYPNVGKSSVINTLRRKKVCKSAPVPGETRIWQYVALTRRLYLLDCPGIVPPAPHDFDADCAKVLKGAVRAERVQTPSDYIDEVLSRVKKPYLLQRYKLPTETRWEDSEEFLTILGKKMGKLLKGGEADIETAARIVLYDWQRGRIPFFTPPPSEDQAEGKSSAVSSTANLTTALTDEPRRAIEGPPADPSESSAAAEEAQRSGKEAAGQEAEGGPETEGTAAIAQLALEQSLDELCCSLQYDEEDRQGEALPATKGESKKRRREAEAKAKSAGERASSAAGRGGSSRRRRKRGGKSGTASNTAAAPLRPGSVDWKAVVAEFDV